MSLYNLELFIGLQMTPPTKQSSCHDFDSRISHPTGLIYLNVRCAIGAKKALIVAYGVFSANVRFTPKKSDIRWVVFLIYLNEVSCSQSEVPP
jgi:hypothetical protein